MLVVQLSQFSWLSDSLYVVHVVTIHYLMMMYGTLIKMMLRCSNVMSSSISCHLLLVLACFTRTLTRRLLLLLRVLSIQLMLKLVVLLIPNERINASMFLFCWCHFLIKQLMQLSLFCFLKFSFFNVAIYHTVNFMFILTYNIFLRIFLLFSRFVYFCFLCKIQLYMVSTLIVK